MCSFLGPETGADCSHYCAPPYFPLQQSLDPKRKIATMEALMTFDNFPESLQESVRGEAMQEAIDNMESALDSIDEAISSVEEAMA